MKRDPIALFVLGVVAFCAFVLPQAVPATDAFAEAGKPADRIVVMYFHRTQRCPTCLKMGSYSEEAVKAGFARQIADGKVEFRYIDFQDKKNEALANGFKVGGPKLIVAHVSGNKIMEYKNLPDIWAKVRDRAAFIEYVQSNIQKYLK